MKRYTYVSLKEVSYHGQSETADARNRRYVCGLRSGPVSRGGYRCLALGVGLFDSVPWFHRRPDPLVAPPQPWIAEGAYDGNRQTQSTRLGQSVFRGGGTVLSCLAGLDAARCCPFPLVTDAGLASGGRSGSSSVFVLPLLPDISGKPVSVARRPYPNRARANGDIHRAVPLCTPSDVCRCHPLRGRHNLLAGVMVRVTGADPRRRDSISSGAGGTRATARPARI